MAAKLPERIWLQWYGEGTPEEGGPPCIDEEITWCVDKIWDHDIEYIRPEQLKADLAKFGGHAAYCASSWLVEPEGVVTGEHRLCDCGWQEVQEGWGC